MREADPAYEEWGMQMNRGLRLLAVAATIVTYIILQMGALVTNTGSGDGCGASWPLCKGTFMPDWDYPAVIEFSHRAVSGVGGLLILILAVSLWRRFPHRPLLRWLGMGALGTVIFQGLLGAAAVLWPQPKAILALHFGISLICFSAVVLVTVLLYRKEQPAPMAPVSPFFVRWVWWVTLFAYGVVYLGAFVRHNKASLACQGWPLCNGQLIPPLYGLVGANFLHRVGAALLVLLVVRLFLMARVYAKARPDLMRGASLALLLIGAQVAGGAVMAMGTFNLLTQMLHSATISLFWGALSFLCLQVLDQGLDQGLDPELDQRRPQPGRPSFRAAARRS